MLNGEVSSAKDIKGYYAHFCNWTQRIHHPLDPPDGAFQRTIQSVHLLHGLIGPIWKNLSIKFEQIWSNLKKYPQIFLVCIIWIFFLFAQISKVQFKVSLYMVIFSAYMSYFLIYSNFSKCSPYFFNFIEKFPYIFLNLINVSTNYSSNVSNILQFVQIQQTFDSHYHTIPSNSQIVNSQLKLLLFQ
jgi:hypothetical protein